MSESPRRPHPGDLPFALELGGAAIPVFDEVGKFHACVPVDWKAEMCSLFIQFRTVSVMETLPTPINPTDA